MKLAVKLLFFRRHLEAGIKGWELKRELGSNYSKILDLLDGYLDKLGLTIKTVFEEELEPNKSPTAKELDHAKFYITLKEDSISPEKLIGWRIDDIAGLAVSLAFIISKGGRVTKDDLMTILCEKIPKWRVEFNLRRFLKAGYLDEDDEGKIYIGWRTRVEVDQKKLVELLLNT